MADTGPAASALEEIRERWSKVAYVGLKPEVVPEPGYQPPWLPDVDHLLKAVDAALSRHRPVIRKQGHPAMCEWDNRRWPCPEVADITAALAGTQLSEDENHG